MRSVGVLLSLIILIGSVGCTETKPDYGTESRLFLPGNQRQSWAIAPIVNLSGQKPVDPLLQADLLYQSVGKISGVTPIPVNRVVEVYNALRLDQIHSEEQAKLVCDLLGCDALILATVNIYDPYEPPKLGASLQLFRRGNYQRPIDVDPRELARRATPLPNEHPTKPTAMVQVIGMFDAADGSVRAEALKYVDGRFDAEKPYGPAINIVDTDRYCRFVYFSLLEEMLSKPAMMNDR